MSTILELENLTKDFGAFRALHGVTAKLPQGAVGLLGPNGAGKSTLVKCLLGLVRPTTGRARVLGIDIAQRPLALRQRVGYLPEVDCHIPGMSAVEFVAYAGELVGMPPNSAMTRAHQVLDYVGLADERYRLVHTYSTGMRQRAKLAQALVHDPELLFLDEPTNGLDPRGRERMIELVRDLASNGISVVYSSHLLADVEQVCSEVLILRQGRVVAQGRLDELQSGVDDRVELRVRGDEEALTAELLSKGVESTAVSAGCYHVRLATETETKFSLSQRVFQAAATTGCQVRAYRPLRSSLEDVFIDALSKADAL